MTKIPVACYERIDEHEILELENGQKILARDVEAMPSMPGIKPMLLYNGRKPTIRKIGNEWYLIERVNV